MTIMKDRKEWEKEVAEELMNRWCDGGEARELIARFAHNFKTEQNPAEVAAIILDQLHD